MINGVPISLESQILKTSRIITTLSANDDVKINISPNFLEAACSDRVRNTLQLQFLRDHPVVYGDEQRTKQEHTYTFEVFYHQLKKITHNGEISFSYSLSPFLKVIQPSFFKGVLNNLVITTDSLRKYHYKKQKVNAFYHIQAINLPFHNIEFYWS